MFIKRQLAIVVMMVMGFLALSGYFINWETLRNFTEKDATNFYMIIAGFAAFLGCLNLLQLHLQKIAYKKDNWQYSIFTLLGFLIMIYFGFIHKGLDGDPYTDLNGDGKWNNAESFTDLNGDAKWNNAEPFIDLNGDGKWNDAEPYENKFGNYEYDEGEKFNSVKLVSKGFVANKDDPDKYKKVYILNYKTYIIVQLRVYLLRN